MTRLREPRPNPALKSVSVLGDGKNWDSLQLRASIVGSAVRCNHLRIQINAACSCLGSELYDQVQSSSRYLFLTLINVLKHL